MITKEEICVIKLLSHINNSKFSLLVNAIIDNNLENLIDLIEVDKIIIQYGDTPYFRYCLLYFAVVLNKIDIIQYLINKNYDIYTYMIIHTVSLDNECNIEYEKNVSILVTATIYNHFDIIKYLLENCHFNQKEYEDSYNMFTLQKDHILLYKLFVYNGLNYNTNDNYQLYKQYSYYDKIIVFLFDYEYQKEKYYLFDINLFKLIFSYLKN